MTTERNSLLAKLGFRFGANGTHAARTMMLEDLSVLFSSVPPDSPRISYKAAVIEDNALAKPTRKARELAFTHLSSLYGLEDTNPIFRALRRLWPLNQAAQPILALAVALARDPLLRGTQPFILRQAPGASVPRTIVEGVLESQCPGRFSASSLQSFAQNVSGTWTSAGFLQGRTRKIRSTVEPEPESLALLLFLGYLEGRTGQRLFSSSWTELLGRPIDELEALASAASHRGLLVFMNAGGVKEVRFPDYLTADEDKVRQEVSHVV